MSPAYIAGAMEYFPGARAVFDDFHITKMAGQALDRARKNLARQGNDLCGALWALRGNAGSATASSSNVYPNSWRLIRPLDARWSCVNFCKMLWPAASGHNSRDGWLGQSARACPPSVIWRQPSNTIATPY